MTEQAARDRALDLAIKSSGLVTDDQFIERAKAFLAFLRGENCSKAKTGKAAREKP